MVLRSSTVNAIAGSLLVLVGLGACDALSGGGDYPSYGSVDELYRSASLVVQARIADGAERRQITIGPDTTAEYTVYRAEIERLFKGTTADQAVEVKQMTDGEDGAVSLNSGTTYVLFLETYSDVPASLLNPTQAQYLVDPSGRLIPVGDNTLQVTLADLERLSAGP